MKLIQKAKRVLAGVMAVLMLSVTVNQAQAAMISNQAIVQQLDRQQAIALFDRADVQEQLTQLGVDSELAKSRVAAMSDAEIAQLNQHLADQPAGQDILGLAFMVFVVFVITDMLGATDVFPFVKNINR
ncbi:PA2779 family protein [Oceanospirillum sanctuarii]|uniref:PA2779 family protein n=1 Tax=Oceanospirillum sanctuarii TaxID=1434821 RepID=UPI00159447F5|nr:PA2779 family protein [Oceanospirillum sanctuarii]